ncbi:MAG: hypothetical protein ABW224_24780 [Kibdelosporangium sp.]
MKAALLLTILVLAGCTSSPEPLADRGAAAITPPITTMNQLVEWMQDKTESCDEVQPATREQFTQFVGSQLAGLYEPFMAEWTTCSLSDSYPKVGLVLFKDLKAFQRSWRDAMTAGRVSDGPAFSFGNGFAVTAGFLGVSELGLYYLRCDYDDPRVHQLPADIDGCVFANPEHSHH